MKIPNRKNTLAFNKLQNDTIIIDFSAEKQFHQVNEVGSLIWELCDGHHTLEKIAEIIHDQYDISLSDALKDVNHFISQLEQNDLLSN